MIWRNPLAWLGIAAVAIPILVHLIGRRGRTSPAWLDASSALIGIFQGAGLRGAALARAYLWVAEITMGVGVNEAMVPFAEQIEAARNAHAQMTPEARQRHEAVFGPLSAMDGDDFFDLVADRTIAAIAEWVEKRGSA